MPDKNPAPPSHVLEALSIDPPQPAGWEYPLNALVPSFIRQFVNQAGYTKATGVVPPAYNPQFPIKTWDDTRKWDAQATVNYSAATLYLSFQFPVIRWFAMSGAMAKSVNIPPDQGPIPPSTAGVYLAPIRGLLVNERLLAHEGGVIDVINTDIFDPDPVQTILQLTKRIAHKVGA